MTARSRWPRVALAVLALGAAIQLVPYGRDRTNPPVAHDPAWSDPATRELFFRACGDCHSNETRWPWYSAVAPVSWLVHWDVEEARSHFNVSEVGGEHDHAEDAAEMVRDREMPLPRYLLLHPRARLSDAERERLARGLDETFRIEETGDEGAPSKGPHAHGAPGHHH